MSNDKSFRTLTASVISLKNIGDEATIFASVDSAREKEGQNGGDYMLFKGQFEAVDKDGNSLGTAKRAILPFIIEEDIAEALRAVQDKRKTASLVVAVRVYITRDKAEADKKVWNAEFLTELKKPEVKDIFADLKKSLLKKPAGKKAA